MVPRQSGDSLLRSYPAHATFVGDARRDLRAFAEKCGVVGTDLDDLVLALGEVLALLVEQLPTQRSGFVVSAKHSNNEIEMIVTDSAARFGKREPPRDAALDRLAPRGLGLAILAKLVDEITFTDNGTRVRLVKRLGPRPPAAEIRPQ